MHTKAANLTREQAYRFERTENSGWEEFYRYATPEAVQECGIEIENLANATVTIASRIDMLAVNRIIDTGLETDFSEESLERAISLYRSRNIPRFFLTLPPISSPPDIPRWLGARKLYHYNNWVKMYRRAEPTVSQGGAITISQIGVSDAELFAEILVNSFDWSRQLLGWIASAVGKPGWYHYIAYDKLTPVAGALLFRKDDIGWLSFAATLPQHRGKGAQSALITRRINDAAELGCRWVTVETAEETAEKGVPSYRNLRRFGFDVAYLRPNYIYKME